MLPATQLEAPVEVNAVAPVPTSPADAGNRVMFLTIVGEQTFVHWGYPGDRPPRVDFAAGARAAAPSPASMTQVAAAVEVPVAAPPRIEPTYGDPDPLRRPYGPAPQECPRTLPPGSDQSTADTLLRQSGCRYLSSCSFDTGECTWRYMGRQTI